MTERKLATIRRVKQILPIAGADKIEIALVDGWQVVVKKGEFKEGQLAVYFEIDSWVPNTIAPFLTKEGYEPKEYNGVKGERLKTIKLRKTLSQGLLLSPLLVLGNHEIGYTEGRPLVWKRLHTFDGCEGLCSWYEARRLLETSLPNGT